MLDNFTQSNAQRYKKKMILQNIFDYLVKIYYNLRKTPSSYCLYDIFCLPLQTDFHTAIYNHVYTI